MTTTPTAALVEEAEKITEGVPADWTACSCNKCGLVWALGEMHIATVELETGESDCAQPSPEQRRRIMDFMARSRSMIPEFATALRRAEAERDAQRAEVLRLTRELEGARQELAEWQDVGAGFCWFAVCIATNQQAIDRFCQVIGRERLEKIEELESTRDLLTEENARLQARVATLELLRRGGK